MEWCGARELELGAAPFIAGARSMVDTVLGRCSGHTGSPYGWWRGGYGAGMPGSRNGGVGRVARARQGGTLWRALCELGRCWAARARACGVGGGQFPCPGGAVLCWERQGAALGLGGRLWCRLRVGDRGGMATVRRAPWVAMITAAARVAPVRKWHAGQVRGVERGGEVQGIDEQQTEIADLILSSSGFGEEQGGAHHLFDQIPQPKIISNF